MRIQKRPRSTSVWEKTCRVVSEGWVWVFGTGLFLLFGTLMLQTSEDIAASQNAHSSALLRAATIPQTPSIIRQGDITCQEVKHKLTTNQWSDPNHGRIFARETVTFPHFRISLHTQDYDKVRWRIMDEGNYYEHEVHHRFIQILQYQPSPSYVLDVGANIGYYTLLSAAFNHSVIALEPNPANILRLCDSIRLNDGFYNQVNIFQRAVSDTSGEMSLIIPNNPGQAFLKPLDEQHQGTADDDHKAKTQVITLDEFAQEQGWFDRKDFTIRLLKIDVEGKEPQVVLGGKRLLQSGLVKNVLTEGRRFGRPNIKESFVALFEAGFVLKEPSDVVMKGSTAQEHAQSVVEYYKDMLGKNSMKTADLWWVKA